MSKSKRKGGVLDKQQATLIAQRFVKGMKTAVIFGLLYGRHFFSFDKSKIYFVKRIVILRSEASDRVVNLLVQ